MTDKSHPAGVGRSPFGELLLRLRTERGLTQERLAAATKGDRISPRSITNYERTANDPRDWVLPHRPALRILSQALDVDLVDQHSLVVAWSKSRTLRDASPAGEDTSDFVAAGREDAVGSIMDAWKLARSGVPHLVFVGGVAGIGKTALTRHVSDKIAASENKVMIAWDGASSWATSVEPYLAVRTATDRILVEPEPSSTIPGRYASRPKLGPAETSRVIESIPLLGGALISDRALRDMAAKSPDVDTVAIDTLLASRSSTETSGRLEEYCRLLVHLSQSWPVVIVLEDLHWAGDPTASLMLYLARSLQHMRDTPILVICTYRNDEVHSPNEGEVHPFNRLLSAVGHSPQIKTVTLNKAMSPTSGMAFVRGVIKQTPMATSEEEEKLAAWMYEQTSGHPLLTNEMVRHLIETTALARTGYQRTWVFDQAKIPADLPSAVSTFIEQRLNRVSHRARRVLEIASTMNDVILTETIAEIMKVDEEDVLEVIDRQLVDTHKLLLQGPLVRLLQRSHASYRFPHSLFREHIYNGLPDLRRRRLHLAVAQAMESRSNDADTATLSEITSHYVLAEDWESAQMAGFRLAQNATIRLDWDLASVWFEQAEELAIKAQDPHQLWRARAARLAVMRGNGDYEAAIELGARIIQLAESHNWPRTLALAYHHLGEIYYDLGNVDLAVEHLERAIELHVQGETHDLAAAGEAMISHATYRQGKYDVARKHAHRALELGRELKNSWVQPEAVLAAANCEADLGFYEQAIANYEMAIELAAMAGKVSNQFIPAMNIGLCHAQLGNYKHAIEYLTDLTERIESHGIFRLGSHAYLYLGYAHEGYGNWDDAKAVYAKTTRIRRTAAKAPVLYDSIAGQLRVAIHQGDSDLARSCLAEITDHLDTHGWEGMEDPLLVKASVAKAYAYFNDEEGYRSYIQRAHALLMERANMLEDDESMTSYLTNVPISLELQKLHSAP